MTAHLFTTDDRIAIGHGVFVEVHRVDGEAYSLTEHHTDPRRQVDAGADANCCGDIRFDNDVGARVYGDQPGPRWKVEAPDPLTVSPSILCRTCGHHGFIRNGKWVPA